MAVVSDRVRERAEADFGPSAPRVISLLERLPVAPQVHPERLHGAVLVAARGSLTMLDDAAEHARDDWRDLLDRAGLADERWGATLDEALGAA